MTNSHHSFTQSQLSVNQQTQFVYKIVKERGTRTFTSNRQTHEMIDRFLDINFFKYSIKYICCIYQISDKDSPPFFKIERVNIQTFFI